MNKEIQCEIAYFFTMSSEIVMRLVDITIFNSYISVSSAIKIKIRLKKGIYSHFNDLCFEV